jgi:hypothetical protein
MRRSAVVLFLFLCPAGAIGHAQAVESAYSRQFTVTAGGMASVFRTGEGGHYLVGAGTFVDMHFSHWVQIEGEGRWLRWNQYHGEHQDNYLIGPRVPIASFGQGTQLFGKAMIGYAKMTFPGGYGYGSFTQLAFGASVDHHLNRKLSVKADFEYQYWPKYLNNTSLSPYGASVGVGYRVF